MMMIRLPLQVPPSLVGVSYIYDTTEALNIYVLTILHTCFTLNMLYDDTPPSSQVQLHENPLITDYNQYVKPMMQPMESWFQRLRWADEVIVTQRHAMHVEVDCTLDGLRCVEPDLPELNVDSCKIKQDSSC